MGKLVMLPITYNYVKCYPYEKCASYCYATTLPITHNILYIERERVYILYSV